MVYKKIEEALENYGLHKLMKQDNDETMNLEEAKSYYNTELDKQLDQAIKESDNGEGRPHEEVWAEISKRYNL